MIKLHLLFSTITAEWNSRWEYRFPYFNLLFTFGIGIDKTKIIRPKEKQQMQFETTE